MIDADMTEMDVVEIALTTAERLGQHALTWKRRLVEAEAAIQRVREVLERYRTSPYSEMSQTDALGAVGRALDGGTE